MVDFLRMEVRNEVQRDAMELYITGISREQYKLLRS